MADLRLFPLLIVFLSIMTGLVAGAAVGFDQPGVVVMPGEMTSINLTLDSAPGGLSGYRIVIGIVDPSIGEITAVTLPEWAQIPEISGTPGPVVSVTAVDLMSVVERGAGGILLATISVKGLAPGTTGILLSDPVVSDEDGFDIHPALFNASLTVTTEAATPQPTANATATTTTGATTNVTAAATTGSSSLTGSSGGGGGSGGGSLTGSSIPPATTMIPGTGGGDTGPAATIVQTETPPPGTSPRVPATTLPETAPPGTGTQGIPLITVPGILVLIGALILLGRKMSS